MVRAWGLLVAILALGCHTTRILAAAEDLGGPEVDDDDNNEVSKGFTCFFYAGAVVGLLLVQGANTEGTP